MTTKGKVTEKFPAQEFDPAKYGEIAVDPETLSPSREKQLTTGVGMYFPRAWYPAYRQEARHWGGYTLIAWRYPPGDYKKPDGSMLHWHGGHSPFKRYC